MSKRHVEDIKILDRMIQRHSRELRKKEESGVTLATTMLGEDLKFLKKARSWLKSYQKRCERLQNKERT